VPDGAPSVALPDVTAHVTTAPANGLPPDPNTLTTSESPSGVPVRAN